MTGPEHGAAEPDGGLEELEYDECIALLGTEQVGRLAVVVGHYPQVFPVNYRLDGHVVVFRTHPGTLLGAAVHANVAFQVDHLDHVARQGWSVLIQGMAEDTSAYRPGPVTERTEALDVTSWAGGERHRLVRVIPAHVSGRRIQPHGPLWATDPHGYL